MKYKYILSLPHDAYYNEGMYIKTHFDYETFSTKKKMLDYLQKNLYSEETRKPFNYTTLKQYEILGVSYQKVNHA